MRQKPLLGILAICALLAVPLGIFINAQVRTNSGADLPIVVNGVANSPQSGATAGQAQTTQNTAYRLSGPYSHKNLSIFLVHGNQTEPQKPFLTLQEALAQKRVVVYETKNVNELAIENLSDMDVYVQSGDIVKGGDQDRMISVDFIVPPKSGRMPIAAFCVESGRWSRRGNEASANFSSSENVVATKDLKLAAKRANSQQAVWDNVTVAQDKLSNNLGVPVNAGSSRSSLQLSMENEKVKESTNSYIKALSDIVKDKPDVIGYVFAINGQVNSADIYSANSLFTKLWPKLLTASAVEAVADLQKEATNEPITADTVSGFLASAEKGDATQKEVTNRVNLVTREDEKSIFFETRDRRQKDAWIHRNYIKK
jgi:hypothetical protein